MKLFRSTLACIVYLSMMSMACAQVGKVTVIVLDYETGVPLSGVDVILGFDNYDRVGAGPEIFSECTTDSEGVCTMWGHGNGRSAAVAVKDTADFYGATEVIQFKGGHSPIATPWNPTIELRLKEKRNPIPMYAKNLSQKRFPEAVAPKGYDPKKGWLEMPADSGTVSYDLEQGDWVEPYGKGKIADIVFNIEREAKVKYIDHSRGYEYERFASGATVEITVSNDGDGFILYPVAEEDRHRGLRMPYEAPLDGYVPVVKKYSTNPREELGEANINKDMNYFFRVRTVKDEAGKVISTHYGKIHGDFLINSSGNDISFAYYLNPTPYDRNVEFKPGSNLLTDLKRTQDPYEP